MTKAFAVKLAVVDFIPTKTGKPVLSKDGAESRKEVVVGGVIEIKN